MRIPSYSYTCSIYVTATLLYLQYNNNIYCTQQVKMDVGIASNQACGADMLEYKTKIVSDTAKRTIFNILGQGCAFYNIESLITQIKIQNYWVLVLGTNITLIRWSDDSALGRFSSWTIQPMDISTHGGFNPGLFNPWTVQATHGSTRRTIQPAN